MNTLSLRRGPVRLLFVPRPVGGRLVPARLPGRGLGAVLHRADRRAHRRGARHHPGRHPAADRRRRDHPLVRGRGAGQAPPVLRRGRGELPAGRPAPACWHGSAPSGATPPLWRDIAYLLGMFVPLVALDLVVVTVWLVFLAGSRFPPGTGPRGRPSTASASTASSSATSRTARTATRPTASTSTRCRRRCSPRPPSSSCSPRSATSSWRPPARTSPSRGTCSARRATRCARRARYSAVQGRCPPRKAPLTPGCTEEFIPNER